MVGFKWIEVSVVCTRLTFWTSGPVYFLKVSFMGCIRYNRPTHVSVLPAVLRLGMDIAINDVTQPCIVGSFDRLRNVSQELTPFYPIQYFRYNPRTRL